MTTPAGPAAQLTVPRLAVPAGEDDMWHHKHDVKESS